MQNLYGLVQYTVKEVSRDCNISQTLASFYLEKAKIKKNGNNYILPFKKDKLKSRFKTWVTKFNRTLPLPLLKYGYVRIYDNDINKYAKKCGYSRDAFGVRLNAMGAKKYYVDKDSKVYVNYDRRLNSTTIVVADIKKENFDLLLSRKATKYKKKIVSTSVPAAGYSTREIMKLAGLEDLKIPSSRYNCVATSIKTFADLNNIKREYKDGARNKGSIYSLSNEQLQNLLKVLDEYKEHTKLVGITSQTSEEMKEEVKNIVLPKEEEIKEEVEKLVVKAPKTVAVTDKCNIVEKLPEVKPGEMSVDLVYKGIEKGGLVEYIYNELVLRGYTAYCKDSLGHIWKGVPEIRKEDKKTVHFVAPKDTVRDIVEKYMPPRLGNFLERIYCDKYKSNINTFLFPLYAIIIVQIVNIIINFIK